uniref:Ketimine reductase mu-crystallin n=1 Tax=Hirondellea gigas TaxID=1518452 RepID=A0A6A7FP68_9CRUS
MSWSSCPIKWISSQEIRAVLQWDVLVPAITEALQAVSTAGAVVQPVRTKLEDKENAGTLMVMPGLVRPCNALATKILCKYPGNAAKGLPTHTSLVLLNDTQTGVPLALLEGDSITELRTAAASAAATLAVRKFNKPTGSPCIVAVLGAGTQGAAHARVMNHILKPQQVRIWSRNGCQSLVSKLSSEGVPAVSCSSVQDAVNGACVINTCTLASKPVLKLPWVMKGAHINSVGAANGNDQEMESDLVRSAQIYADTAEAVMKEAGDLILSGSKLEGEIGEVIKGTLKPTKGMTTIFKSVGMAAEDAVAARLVYDTLYPSKH